MASFLLKINCILPVLKTKKTLFTHFQQCVLSFNSWSMLLKSKDNTVVAKQQSAEMLNIYKVLFLLNLQTALHTPLVDTREFMKEYSGHRWDTCTLLTKSWCSLTAPAQPSLPDTFRRTQGLWASTPGFCRGCQETGRDSWTKTPLTWSPMTYTCE